MLFTPPTYALFTGTAPTWSSTGTLSTFPVIAGTCTDLGIHDASFTLQISAKEDAGSSGGLFGTGPVGSSRQSMHIHTNADSTVKFNLWGSDCAAPAFADASFRGNSEWNTYAFIYDKDASTMTILINGAEVNQCNGRNSFLCSTGANEDFKIGCIYGIAGCDHAIVGEIKDVSIWGGTALTQSELAATAVVLVIVAVVVVVAVVGVVVVVVQLESCLVLWSALRPKEGEEEGGGGARKGVVVVVNLEVVYGRSEYTELSPCFVSTDVSLRLSGPPDDLAGASWAFLLFGPLLNGGWALLLGAVLVAHHIWVTSSSGNGRRGGR